MSHASHTAEALEEKERRADPIHDAGLALEFKEFIKTAAPGGTPMTQTMAARKMGVDNSALSSWLNGNPVGRWKLVEANVADFLRTEPLRRTLTEDLFETATSKLMRNVYNNMVETSHIGMFLGNSGIGKTSAVKLLLKEHPLATLVTAFTLGGSAGSMVYRLANLISLRGFREWKREHRGGSKLDFIISRFAGSQRMFFVDNCHRLTVSGIEFWFDFRDQTGCPVMFVGCLEFMDRLGKVRNNDQQLSRTGELWVCKMDGCETMASGLVKQFLPDHAGELLPLATRAAAEPGHGRTLSCRLELTRKALLRSGGNGDVKTIFEDSRSMLPNRKQLST